MTSYGPMGNDTVWSLIARRAALEPEAIGVRALTSDDGGELAMTNSALAEGALRIAATLDAAGVKPGDRVALFGLNSITYLQVMAATSGLGCTVVPLNAVLTASELAYQIGDAAPAALVCQAALADTLDKAAESAAWSGPRLVYGGTATGWDRLDDGTRRPFNGPGRRSNSEPFEILYTSGTSAAPKGVVLSERSVVEEARRAASYWALHPDDVMFLVLPMFHVNAQMCSLFPALLTGAPVVIADRFSASAWSRQVRGCRATVCSIVGTQLRMLLAQPPDPDDAHNALRCIPYGLNVPAEMWHRFEHRFGAPLINIYGMTEALGPAVTSPLFGDRRVPSIGRIGLDREVMIADPDGSPVPTGEIGEILIKGVPGRSLLVQYYGKPEVTAAALRDGWLHTGDMGRADADGYLYFVDRLKDMIKSSGENVSAAEVEAAISRLDGVRDVAVVGRPDPVRDEAVVAFVIADAGSVTPDSVTAHCREHLARFKVPADVRLVDELPRTSIGKIEKRTLRALLERD